jgi:hypothetical protein
LKLQQSAALMAMLFYPFDRRHSIYHEWMDHEKLAKTGVQFKTVFEPAVLSVRALSISALDRARVYPEQVVARTGSDRRQSLHEEHARA